MIKKSRHNPSLRQLQLFRALVETKSLTKVAEQQHISQPSVSIQLKKMADLIGAELYRVESKKIIITAAGQRVYETALEISASLGAMHDSLSVLSNTPSGHLVLGATPSSQYQCTRWIAAFLKAHDAITIELKVMPKTALQQALSHGHCDLMICTDIDSAQFQVVNTQVGITWVVIGHQHHTLARNPNISIQRLQHYPFIGGETGSETDYWLQQLCLQHQVRIHPQHRLGSHEAVQQAVLAQLGLGIIATDSLLPQHRSAIKTLTVEHFPLQTPLHIGLALTSKPDSLAAYAAQWFSKAS